MEVEGGQAKPSKRPYRMAARADAVAATAETVLDVAVELFTERAYGDVSLEDVAERARVTKRTVQRRFGPKDQLFLAAMNRAAEEMKLQRDSAPAGDVVGAVANVVEHYERWGLNRLRLLEQTDRIPVIAETVESGRMYHRTWVEHTFAPLLTGLTGDALIRRIAALVAVTDVYTWKLLRLDFGLSRTETERTLVEMIG